MGGPLGLQGLIQQQLGANTAPQVPGTSPG